MLPSRLALALHPAVAALAGTDPEPGPANAVAAAAALTATDDADARMGTAIADVGIAAALGGGLDAPAVAGSHAAAATDPAVREAVAARREEPLVRLYVLCNRLAALHGTGSCPPAGVAHRILAESVADGPPEQALVALEYLLEVQGRRAGRTVLGYTEEFRDEALGCFPTGTDGRQLRAAAEDRLDLAALDLSAVGYEMNDACQRILARPASGPAARIRAAAWRLGEEPHDMDRARALFAELERERRPEDAGLAVTDAEIDGWTLLREHHLAEPAAADRTIDILLEDALDAWFADGADDAPPHGLAERLAHRALAWAGAGDTGLDEPRDFHARVLRFCETGGWPGSPKDYGSPTRPPAWREPLLAHAAATAWAIHEQAQDEYHEDAPPAADPAALHRAAARFYLQRCRMPASAAFLADPLTAYAAKHGNAADRQLATAANRTGAGARPSAERRGMRNVVRLAAVALLKDQPREALRLLGETPDDSHAATYVTRDELEAGQEYWVTMRMQHLVLGAAMARLGEPAHALANGVAAAELEADAYRAALRDPEMLRIFEEVCRELFRNSEDLASDASALRTVLPDSDAAPVRRLDAALALAAGEAPRAGTSRAIIEQARTLLAFAAETGEAETIPWPDTRDDGAGRTALNGSGAPAPPAGREG